MEREVRKCFKKGLLRSFHGWSQDKETEMEMLRTWIFEKEETYDFYHYLCKFSFNTYELNDILFTLQGQVFPNVHSMVNAYASVVSKRMIQEMILFVDDNL
jgi:hypothetical protein